MEKKEKKSIVVRDEKKHLLSEAIEPGKILKTALANLSVEQQQDLMNKAANEALDLEIKKEKMQMDHHVSQADIQNHISTFRDIDKEGKLTRHKVSSDVKTASGSMKIESKSGGACFVATVAYDNEKHINLDYLRKFRDTILFKSKQGKRFINWYNVNGPVIASFVKQKIWIKKIIRKNLDFFILALKKIYKL